MGSLVSVSGTLNERGGGKSLPLISYVLGLMTYALTTYDLCPTGYDPRTSSTRSSTGPHLGGDHLDDSGEIGDNRGRGETQDLPQVRGANK